MELKPTTSTQELRYIAAAGLVSTFLWVALLLPILRLVG